jgi:hypothetical protein
MPDLKPGRGPTSLYRLESPGDLVGDPDPGGGFAHLPVGEPAEVVDLRLVRCHGLPDGGASSTRPLSLRVGDLVARRDTLLARAQRDSERTTAPRQPRHYRCLCQHVFQIFGGGRHRRYYELTDPGCRYRVTGNVCPYCQRRLPGVNALYGSKQVTRKRWLKSVDSPPSELSRQADRARAAH